MCGCSSFGFAQKDENGREPAKTPNNLCELGNRILNEMPVPDKAECGGTISENLSRCFLHLNTMCTRQNDETIYKITCVNVCSPTPPPVFKTEKGKLLSERKQKALLPINVVLSIF